MADAAMAYPNVFQPGVAFRAMPIGSPLSSASMVIPAASKALRSAARLLPIGDAAFLLELPNGAR